MSDGNSLSVLEHTADLAIASVEAAFGRPFGKLPVILPLTYENAFEMAQHDPSIDDPVRYARRCFASAAALYDPITHTCYFRAQHNAWRRTYAAAHELTHAFVENTWSGVNMAPERAFERWVATGSRAKLEAWFCTFAAAEGIAEHVARTIGVEEGHPEALVYERKFARRLEKTLQKLPFAVQQAIEESACFGAYGRKGAENFFEDTGYLVGQALVRAAQERTGDLFLAYDGLVRNPPITVRALRKETLR